MILALKTDSSTAELYMLDAEGSQISQDVWEAGHQLSVQLLSKIEKLLHDNKTTWQDLSGIVVYSGPGSYTGLRIGITVANTIAYAQKVPISGAGGSDWLKEGLKKLSSVPPGGQVTPEYGGEANITKPRK